MCNSYIEASRSAKQESARLELILGEIWHARHGIYHFFGQKNVIHVDEKWFYLEKLKSKKWMFGAMNDQVAMNHVTIVYSDGHASIICSTGWMSSRRESGKILRDHLKRVMQAYNNYPVETLHSIDAFHHAMFRSVLPIDNLYQFFLPSTEIISRAK